MEVQDIVALQSTVLHLALKCYADRVEYVDKVLEVTEQIFSNMNLDQ
jgi:vacuolar protein sorting-associated protein 35